MKVSIKTAVILFGLITVFSLSGCSGDSEKNEKSAIDRINEKNAEKIVEQINIPLDKAKAAAESVNLKAAEIQSAGQD